MSKILLILNQDNLNKFTPYIANLSYIYTNDLQYINLLSLIQSYDTIIINGGAIDLTYPNYLNYPNLKYLIEIIHTCDLLNKLLIGICLGCELIAFAYGMEIRKLNVPHNGYFLHIDQLTLKTDYYLKNLDPLLLQYSVSRHKNGIYPTNMLWDFHFGCKHVEALIDILAYSITGIPYIIKHKNKKIYGFQFHPEYSDPIVATNFFESFYLNQNQFQNQNTDNYIMF